LSYELRSRVGREGGGDQPEGVGEHILDSARTAIFHGAANGVRADGVSVLTLEQSCEAGQNGEWLDGHLTPSGKADRLPPEPTYM